MIEKDISWRYLSVCPPFPMQRALASSGLPSAQATVAEALRLLVRLKAQERIRAARGTLRWEGDRDAMRREITPA